MKQRVLIAIFLALTPTWSAAASPQDFTFERYSGDFYLSKNEQGHSRLRVEERFVANFVTPNQHRGIERALPKSYNGLPLNIAIQSVTNDASEPYSYTTYSDQNDNLVVQIGDADTRITGTFGYRIIYTIENVITFYDDHDEFFWDTHGSDWLQPFDLVEAQIHIPADLAPALQDRQQCFTGRVGSQASDCSLERYTSDEGVVVISSSIANVAPNEGLSVVLGWDSGTFTPDPWPQQKQTMQAISGGILPLLTAAFMRTQWQKRGKDPQGTAIVAEFSPPDGINPMSADTILEEKFRQNSISASIVALAVGGYIGIHETVEKKILKDKTHYTLELKKSGEDLSAAEQIIITELFGSHDAIGTTVDLSTQSNKLYPAVAKLRASIPKDLTKNGYFVAVPGRVKGIYYALGGVVSAGSIIGFALAPLVGAGVLLSGLIILLSAHTMPARTKSGVALKNYLLGMEQYIGMAEKDRIAYLQSPEGASRFGTATDTGTQIQLFETLLPYAMIFGLEKAWAKQFEHLYTTPPEWYSSPSGTFNSVLLANSLGGLSTQAQNAFTPQSSSGSSGFSGGSSGGGGGGGGGGGW